jgi:hypothetical protein
MSSSLIHSTVCDKILSFLRLILHHLYLLHLLRHSSADGWTLFTSLGFCEQHCREPGCTDISFPAFNSLNVHQKWESWIIELVLILSFSMQLNYVTFPAVVHKGSNFFISLPTCYFLGFDPNKCEGFLHLKFYFFLFCIFRLIEVPPFLSTLPFS